MKSDNMTIHIGQPKAGSTSLQSALYHGRTALADNGIYFPDIYPHNGNGVILGYHLLNDPTGDIRERIWLHKSRSEAKALAVEAWDKIRAHIQTQRPKQLLLSSELYFSLLDDQTVQRLHALTDDLAHTKTIVAYLRRPDQHYLSSLQQQLKILSAPPPPPRDIMTQRLGPLFRHWPGEIRLRIFDKTAMKNGNIVDDFCAHFLTGMTPETLGPARQPANVSLSAEVMALLHDMSAGRLDIRGPFEVMFKQLKKADRRVPNPTRPQLYPHISEALLNWFAPDLMWLREEHQIVFPGLPDTRNVPTASPVAFQTIEDICKVDQDRKAIIWDRAVRRARLPAPLRRWLAKW